MKTKSKKNSKKVKSKSKKNSKTRIIEKVKYIPVEANFFSLADNTVFQIIKNYDYNKIFNIDNPPIKKILESYIDSIDNFYLFFVVTNNNKEDSTGNSINTCDKQMQLIWDTRHFMNVIAEDNPASMKC